jgi:hypothetical protein
MKTAWLIRRRQRPKRAGAPKSFAAPPLRSAAMRKKLSYSLLVVVPAAAAIAMAPAAAADTPVCTGNQNPQYDNCVARSPEGTPGGGGLIGLVATGAQDVYLTGPPEVTFQRTPSSVPDSAQDVNQPGNPQVGAPPSGGCGSIMCMTANGAQDVYTP